MKKSAEKKMVSIKEFGVVTVKDLASQLNVSGKTILRASKELFEPGTVLSWVINGGKTSVFTEEQATAIKLKLRERNNLKDNSIVTQIGNDLEFFALIKKREIEQKALDEYRDRRISELSEENEELKKENEMLKHQVDYNAVIGCSRWMDVKKLLGIKEKWDVVCSQLDLEENVDFFKRCMGYEPYPTIQLPDSTVEKIKKCFWK